MTDEHAKRLVAEVQERHRRNPPRRADQAEAELRMAEAGIRGPAVCSCGGPAVPPHDGLPRRCLTCGKRK